jgi:hypothetical protein
MAVWKLLQPQTMVLYCRRWHHGEDAKGRLTNPGLFTHLNFVSLSHTRDLSDFCFSWEMVDTRRLFCSPVISQNRHDIVYLYRIASRGVGHDIAASTSLSTGRPNAQPCLLSARSTSIPRKVKGRYGVLGLPFDAGAADNDRLHEPSHSARGSVDQTRASYRLPISG